MVEVEIRAPQFDEETQEVVWRNLARVRVDGVSVEIDGDETCVPNDSVVSVSTGNVVHREDAPEEWARNLPYAYRSGDLVAVILHDDNPSDLSQDDDIQEPDIPEVPVAEEAEDAQTVGV